MERLFITLHEKQGLDQDLKMNEPAAGMAVQ